jgi:uncharacterized protein Yka (UPF0111/DUF47 family)
MVRNLQAASVALRDMLEHFDDLDRRIAEIQALEKRGDEIDRELNQRSRTRSSHRSTVKTSTT